MKNLWNDTDEQTYISRYRGKYYTHPDTEKEILRQAYATTLLGADSALTMHGGGNTSIKVNIVDEAGKEKHALYVKATGTPLNLFEPEYFVVMDLDGLEGLKSRVGLDDADMASEFKRLRLARTDRLPSIESLMHAFIPAKIVDHSHPEALLKITNRAGGADLLTECFGKDLAVTPYARMGYDLASAVSESVRRNVGCGGVFIVHHGLVVWGDGAREVYDLTIEIVNRAERFLASMPSKPIRRGAEVSAAESERNYQKAAPLIREALGGGDVSLILLNAPDVMELINSPDASILRNPPLTPDYPMLRRILPLWLDVDLHGGIDELSSYIKAAVDKHVKEYGDYLGKRGVSDQPIIDLLPKAIVHPRMGAVCFGTDEAAAAAVGDFTRQAFSIRRAIFESGGVYRCLAEEYLFDMQYRGYQRDKAAGESKIKSQLPPSA
ncbi:MAG: class II aldolase/adducin family protein [Chitinispirillales bacterium]|jgi:rhamnose utilization protein RhaD (predicted bifunctional aldolase and dehydrogenase)|nr:class II aldolase/adducin family protein [Chitinispirillales bacterium]